MLSVINYGIIAWGGICDKTLKTLVYLKETYYKIL